MLFFIATCSIWIFAYEKKRFIREIMDICVFLSKNREKSNVTRIDISLIPLYISLSENNSQQIT